MIRNDKHQLVPVIGSDVFYVQEGQKEILLYDYLFGKVIKDYIDPRDQDEVLRECTGSHLRRMKKLQSLMPRWVKREYKQAPSIYSCIAMIMKEAAREHKIRLRETVRDFLQYGNFPLIITTCFSDLLEELLMAPHGKRYQRVGYYCQSSKEQDIDSSIENTPTVFHLFGISESGAEPMITEDDFLKYLHCLHNTSAPSNLKAYLKRRTVLALGCNVPDWAFRFILLSLTEEDGRIKERTNLLGGAIMRDMEQNDEFQEFLDEIRYLHGNDIDTFLQPINESIHCYKLFLSYSASENTMEWDGIQEILSKLEKNYKVWFFNEQTKDKYGERYWDLIQDGLKECDVFLAIVTQDMVEKMKKVSHGGPKKDYDAGFLWEWKMMMGEQQSRPNNRKALCLGYFLGTTLKDVQTIINDPQKPLSFLKPIFDDNQNIDNVSPANFDPDQFIPLRKI